MRRLLPMTMAVLLALLPAPPASPNEDRLVIYTAFEENELKTFWDQFKKDLPDLALLATARPVEATRLRAAIEQTFTFRKTHACPRALPAPLESWRPPYAAMARDDQLPWPTLDAVTDAARAFLDPVLTGDLDATWEPSSSEWRVK